MRSLTYHITFRNYGIIRILSIKPVLRGHL